MIPIAGQPILTAAEMRAAEDAVMATGVSVDALMERAVRRVSVERGWSGADAGRPVRQRRT